VLFLVHAKDMLDLVAETLVILFLIRDVLLRSAVAAVFLLVDVAFSAALETHTSQPRLGRQKVAEIWTRRGKRGASTEQETRSKDTRKTRLTPVWKFS